MNSVFMKAVPVLNAIEENGYDAYFVGGSVRDFLLQREIDDVDIASSATPEEIKTIFPKTLDVGIEHGTVIVIFNGDQYEVTTFRTESEYIDFRRPTDVQFIRSLREDLQRRDFTMNAIAMDKDGNIIDPFNGQESIKNGVICTVGNAEERFTEDALRMMRAVRFVSQLSFQIEESTYIALKVHGHLLKKIAVERITVEFEKLLAGKNRIQGLKILIDTNLFQHLPGLQTYENELRNVTNVPSQELTVDEMWVLMIHYLRLAEKDISSFLRTWKLSNKKSKFIENVARFLEARLKNEWTISSLYEAGIETFKSTERILNVLLDRNVHDNIMQLEITYRNLPIKNRSEIQVTGNDMIEWSARGGGPWIKDLMAKIEKAILHGEVSNQKESIREWLQSCNLY